jgi:hypothetical protein
MKIMKRIWKTIREIHQFVVSIEREKQNAMNDGFGSHDG